MNKLSLVLNLKLPHRFKTPNFEKFDDIKCPKTHVIVYHNRMTNFNNDMLMIHYFQDNLERGASKLYSKLDKAHIKTWNDLVDAL